MNTEYINNFDKNWPFKSKAFEIYKKWQAAPNQQDAIFMFKAIKEEWKNLKFECFIDSDLAMINTTEGKNFLLQYTDLRREIVYAGFKMARSSFIHCVESEHRTVAKLCDIDNDIKCEAGKR